MKYYVTWTGSDLRPARQEIVDYAGSRTDLAKMLGDTLLKELQALLGNAGKQLKIMVSDRAGVIHCAEGIIGTVSVELYRGEGERAILNWLQ